jgi:hypothetical protein
MQRRPQNLTLMKKSNGEILLDVKKMLDANFRAGKSEALFAIGVGMVDKDHCEFLKCVNGEVQTIMATLIIAMRDREHVRDIILHTAEAYKLAQASDEGRRILAAADEIFNTGSNFHSRKTTHNKDENE